MSKIYPYAGEGSLMNDGAGLSIILSTKIGFSTYSTYFTAGGGGDKYT